MLVWLLAGAAFAGALEPRAKPDLYPHRAGLGRAMLGVEYYGRAYDGPCGAFLTRDYLIVEVALFAPEGQTIPLAPGDFRLRLNSAKLELLPATSGSVAAGIRNPDLFEQRPTVIAGGGAGPGQIVLGRPRPYERFPGDPEARVPGRAGAEPLTVPKEAETAAAAALRCALDRSEASPAGAAGLVYFFWRGKHARLKKIELIYDGPPGKHTFRLR